MLRVCIASIQNVERSLLLLVVSASDIPLRTIKFFSVLFSSAYWSMLQAVTNTHSMVRRRLCDLHCMVVSRPNCFFVISQFSRPAIDRQPVVRGRLCHILSFVVGKCFWHFVRDPAIFDSQLAKQARPIFCLHFLHSTPPQGGGFPVGISPPRLVRKNQIWCGYPMVKKNSKICLFVLTRPTNVTDRRTDRHRMTSIAALIHSIGQQKRCEEPTCRVM